MLAVSGPKQGLQLGPRVLNFNTERQITVHIMRFFGFAEEPIGQIFRSIDQDSFIFRRQQFFRHVSACTCGPKALQTMPASKSFCSLELRPEPGRKPPTVPILKSRWYLDCNPSVNKKVYS